MKEKGITGSRRPESSPKMLPLQVANSQQRRGQFLGGENGSSNRRDNCILNNIIGLHLSMGIASNIGDNMKLKTIAFIIACAGIAATQAFAEAAKFYVDGDTLFYDTEKAELDRSFVTISDAGIFRRLLNEHPEVTQIDLHSYGGNSSAGVEIARVLSDFNVTTVVSGECSSACATIFLSGAKRKLKPGALIGFHRPEWSVDGMTAYYDRNKDREGWSTPFEFASWVSYDAMHSTTEVLGVYLSSGVDYAFALKTLRVPQSNMWYPTRSELISVGVLSEETLANLSPRLRPIQRPTDVEETLQLSSLY